MFERSDIIGGMLIGLLLGVLVFVACFFAILIMIKPSVHDLCIENEGLIVYNGFVLDCVFNEPKTRLLITPYE